MLDPGPEEDLSDWPFDFAAVVSVWVQLGAFNFSAVVGAWRSWLNCRTLVTEAGVDAVLDVGGNVDREVVVDVGDVVVIDFVVDVDVAIDVDGVST